MYVEQIEAGDTYKIFKRCVSISLLNFTLFPDTEDFYSCFHLWEDTRHTLYTDKMEFYVLEFPFWYLNTSCLFGIYIYVIGSQFLFIDLF